MLKVKNYNEMINVNSIVCSGLLLNQVITNWTLRLLPNPTVNTTVRWQLWVILELKDETYLHLQSLKYTKNFS